MRWSGTAPWRRTDGDGTPTGDLDGARKVAGAPLQGSGDPDASRKEPLQAKSGAQARGSSSESPRVKPVRDIPTLPVRLPSSRSPAVQLPRPGSCFDKNCISSQAPVVDRGRYDLSSFDQIHEQCRKRGYSRKDSKAAPKTRLASLAAEKSKRTLTEGYGMDTSATAAGSTVRPPADAAEYLNRSHHSQDKGGPVVAFRLTFLADKEVLKVRARGRKR